MGDRVLALLLGALCLMLQAAAPARASDIAFIERAEIVFSDARIPPETGWELRSLPQPWLTNEMRERKLPQAAWVRLTFTYEGEGQPLAFYAEGMRHRIAVFHNQDEVFRSFRDDSENTLGWNRPFLVPLRKSQLEPGTNLLEIRIDSPPPMGFGIGKMAVGPLDPLKDHYDHQYFWSVEASASVNLLMLFLAVAAFLLWLRLPQERELLWLIPTAIFWYIRDFGYFGEKIPVDPLLYHHVMVASIYFAYSAMLAFCLEYLKIPGRGRAIATMFGASLGFCLLRQLEMAIRGNDTDIITNLLALATIGWFVWLIIRHWWGERTRDALIIVLVLFVGLLITVHDLGRSSNVQWWDGIGINLQPYDGPMLFGAFMMLVGARVARALNTVESVNIALETGIAQARAELARSEERRRELEVQSAVESERERLMREMHDGIGSNLVTALAIAKQADESPRTIATLKRAISDLKITVDSLAPVEGDVVALLANFRHRAGPDLAEAGLRCEWRVENCPSLAWLNSENALHMLRIIQEAVGNVLTHAEAKTLIISCMPEAVEGRAGVAISISDDGRGYAMDIARSQGRGIDNMRARATSLGGRFACTSAIGEGTRVTLWLPADR
jgi:signal transduction histidine kinase